MCKKAREDAITDVLNRLLNLPLWAIGRAGSLEWFQFGTKRIVPTLRGGKKEVGEIALHVDCPWRLLDAAGNLVASDESAREILSAVASPPLTCCGVSVRSPGHFTVDFLSGEQILVEAVDEECLEYWRLFWPASEKPHFVIGPAGSEAEPDADPLFGLENQ
jgi:hypothetical protein